MNFKPVQYGNLASILQYPVSELQMPDAWTQMDSDILAHLVNVLHQIQNSRWYKTNHTCKYQGEEVLDHTFGDIEDFVYVAIYIRQFIVKRDSLLNDAVERYSNYTSCEMKIAWVKYELNAFNNALVQEPFMLEGCTRQELFDAFMYGAALFHKIPDVNDKTRKRFLDIYDNQPRHKVMIALHFSLKMLVDHIVNVTCVIQRDYSYWLDKYNLPKPDTRWHEKLFKIKIKGEK